MVDARNIVTESRESAKHAEAQVQKIHNEMIQSNIKAHRHYTAFGVLKS